MPVNLGPSECRFSRRNQDIHFPEWSWIVNHPNFDALSFMLIGGPWTSGFTLFHAGQS